MNGWTNGRRVGAAALFAMAMLGVFGGCADESARGDAAAVSVTVRYDSLLAFATDGGYNYAAASQALGLEDAEGRRRPLIVDWGLEAVPNDPQSAKAFWIDAYNVSAIAGVLRHYPTASVMDIKDYFTAPVHDVLGLKLSLDQIEKEKLLDDPPDARIHFAIVCASRGCPPLLSVPYRSVGNLDSVLDAQAVRTVNDSYYVEPGSDGTWEMSNLFEWYAQDFRAYAGSVEGFVARYHRDSTLDGGRKWDIHYRDYDWSLNQKPITTE